MKHHETRYYNETEKTVEECASHGADHRAYGWSPQIDPRWSDEQVAAYRAAYEGRQEPVITGRPDWETF